jgi:hypothetical protein
VVDAETLVAGIDRERGRIAVSGADVVDAAASCGVLEFARAIHHADGADVIALGQQQFQDELWPKAKPARGK